MGDICEITAKQVDPRIAEFAALPHVNGTSIESGTCRLLRSEAASSAGLISSKYLFESGDVLYSKLRPYLRKVVVAENRGVCSADMYPIRVTREIADPRFLAWLLVTDEFTKYAIEESARARMPKLNREQLFAWQTALPPIDEQHRILAVLERQMAVVERARAAAEVQREAANAFSIEWVRSVFEQKEQSGSRRVPLGGLSNSPNAFADGPFGSNLKTEHYTSTGARVVRLQNIGRGEFLDADKAYVSLEHFAHLARHHVQSGDVVVAALGDGARPAGRACTIPNDFGPGLVKADCFRVRLPQDVILPEYLVAYLNSPDSLRSVSELMRGATRPRVNLEMLRQVVLPVPSVAVQRELLGALHDRNSRARVIQAAGEDQLRVIAALPAALLRRAFDGAL